MGAHTGSQPVDPPEWEYMAQLCPPGVFLLKVPLLQGPVAVP